MVFGRGTNQYRQRGMSQASPAVPPGFSLLRQVASDMPAGHKGTPWAPHSYRVLMLDTQPAAPAAPAVDLQGVLADEAAERMVSKVGDLPSLPANLVALDAALADEDCSLGRIAGIVGSDVAISAKVLRFVNSSFFGLKYQIRDLRQAVAYMGMRGIRDYVVADAAFKAFQPSPLLPGTWIETFNNHAVAVSEIAGRLARTSQAQCEATVAGMLHGIGELVVAERAPKELVAVAADIQAGGNPAEVQRRHLGTSYPMIGGYLLAKWRLDRPVVEAVASQGELWSGLAREPELTDVLSVADHLAVTYASYAADEVDPGLICNTGRYAEIDEEYISRVGLLEQVQACR